MSLLDTRGNRLHEKGTVAALNAAAVIVAGGSGARMGGAIPKQYRMLGDKPVLAHTIAAFENSPSVTRIVLVLPEGDREGYYRTHCEDVCSTAVDYITTGGPTRQESVWRGLAGLNESFEVIAIHDGVRPLVSWELIEKCIQEAAHLGAVVPGLPLTDTIKSVGPGGVVGETVSREGLWSVQTPQVFRRQIIFEAYERAFREGHHGTDDAGLVERSGGRVTVVEGSRDNIKITYERDLLLAEAILGARQDH